MVILLLMFSGMTLFLSNRNKDERLYRQITSNLFREEMYSNTLNMHYTIAHPEDFGLEDYKVMLPGYSMEESLISLSCLENLLCSLRSIHTDKLEVRDAYLCKLLIRYLENCYERNSYPYYSEPLSPSSGMQSQLPILLAEYSFRTKRDVEDYLSLLEQTDEYFASLVAYEQEKKKAGLIMPASALDDVIQQCDTIVTCDSLADHSHFLQTTFRERVSDLLNQGIITAKEGQQYIDQNDRLLLTVLLPAYEALGDGLLLLKDNTIPLAGLSSHPDGKSYYEALLKSQTGSYRSIPEIRNLLTEQFQSDYAAIKQILADHPELASTYGEIDATMFPCQTPEDILADLQDRMKSDFPFVSADAKSASNHTASVKPVSANLQEYCAPAFYLTAPLDDTGHHVIYINEPKTPRGLELYTTLAHEGYPGHLYQTLYHNLRVLGNKENPAGELIWYGGYLEGWALYTEFRSYDYASDLLKESGKEELAVSTQLQKHSRSLQLCLYGMMDLMIHYDNASYSEIVKVLEGFGVTDPDSAKAVYRYIALEPCNYLKYYLGYLEILSLKEEAKMLWGETYTDLQFHTFLLDYGPADFTSLREKLLVITAT